MRLSVAGKFWLSYTLAMALFIGLFVYSCNTKAASELYKLVMCPANWHATVSQRYDDRDAWGWIVKRTWITKCY